MRLPAILLASFAALFVLAVPCPRAETSVLENGVLILENPVAQSFSTYPPEGWCQNYRDNYAITSCDQQVNRIDTPPIESECGETWYVLAAWTEAKEFSQVEFGLVYPSYDWMIFSRGACFPDQGIETATPDWPDPGAGVRLQTTTVPWSGNFVPVYFFCGIGYYMEEPHVIALGPHPASGFAGFTNTLDPPQSWGASCLGALGWRTDGIYCCPQGAQDVPEEPELPRTTWGEIKSTYR